MGCQPSKSADAEAISEAERAMSGRKGIGSSERIPRKKPDSRVKKAPQSSNGDGNDVLTAPKLNGNGELMVEEVVKRISGSIQTKDVVLGDFRSGDETDLTHIHYAVKTQRGYYPDNPHKENQDSYFLSAHKFGNGAGDAFFAVFDGHGDRGGDCAKFAKKNLPLMLSQHLKKQRAGLNAAALRSGGPDAAKQKGAFDPANWPHLSEVDYETACRAAHLKCNKAMHDDRQVKDMMSGTTSISVGFHAGRMTVCNVGDSRVVLGYRVPNEDAGNSQEEEKCEIEPLAQSKDANDKNNVRTLKAGELIAIPLSEDQTPYRKDERERLKKAGARICSIDQMEGIAPMHDDWGEVNLGEDIDEEGDPPRVWCQDHDYPGTAFSRSLGDTAGEDVGVSAEPEILTKRVTKGDEILVIASDGVFEFLTNQRVIEICAESKDPLEACDKLLAASYERWLEYELRTDDITCIVLFMKNGKPDDECVTSTLLQRQTRVKSVNSKKSKRDSFQSSSSIVLPKGSSEQFANLDATEQAPDTTEG